MRPVPLPLLFVRSPVCYSFIFANSFYVDVLISSPVRSLELFEAPICWSICYCSIGVYIGGTIADARRDLKMLSHIFLESCVESYQAAQRIHHAILWSFNVLLSSLCVSTINRCAAHYLPTRRNISFLFFSEEYLSIISMFSRSCSTLPLLPFRSHACKIFLRLRLSSIFSAIFTDLPPF